MSGTTTFEDDSPPWHARSGELQPLLYLAMAWSREQPGRIGETAAIAGPTVLGRGEPEPEPGVAVARFERWRPLAAQPTPPLGDSRLSRVQLRMRPLTSSSLAVENLGRCRMLINGVERNTAEVRVGDTLTLRNTLILTVVRRAAPSTALGGTGPAQAFTFGEPDPHGIVGESAAAWQLRAELAFAARTDHHVLLRGPSGVGKELAARTVHAMSSRAGRPLIARNAATFPEGLVDAELFGCAKNYPNVGSPERAGLVGEADGSFLFLDEIGELAPAMQAHLLRVLDRGGEYQRLGETRLRRSDLRLIAATNRPLTALKHDFTARFTSRVELPGLEARREDIPLLLRAILRRAADRDASVHSRFFLSVDDGAREPRVDPALIEALLRHPFTHHTRELERIAWRAIATSPGEFVALTPEAEAEMLVAPAAVNPEPAGAARPPVGNDVDLESIDRAQIQAALAAADGRAAVAAERLGLRNRYVLYRLMKKHGIRQADE
jgi:DNA-binding NtrC family response regulator